MTYAGFPSFLGLRLDSDYVPILFGFHSKVGAGLVERRFT